MNFHALDPEELAILCLTISLKLSVAAAGKVRMSLVCQLARTLKRNYTHSLIGLGIEKSRGDLAVIHILETSFAQSSPGHSADSISHTSVDLDPYYKLLSISPLRIV